jgi:hypothetical protein
MRTARAPIEMTYHPICATEIIFLRCCERACGGVERESNPETVDATRKSMSQVLLSVQGDAAIGPLFSVPFGEFFA